MSICATCAGQPCTCPITGMDPCFFCGVPIPEGRYACHECGDQWWFLWTNNFAAACTISCQNGDDELAKRRLWNELKAIGMV